nr:phosphotransferase [Deinococcus sp. AJ005]
MLARVDALPTAQEDFALPFEAELRADLQSLHSLTPEVRPGLHQLRDLLGPHEPHLQTLMTRITKLQTATRARSHEFVVCHTDAHGGNVIRDVANQLWIIDWETARLAPREHDLWMLHARLPEVLPAYQAALG